MKCGQNVFVYKKRSMEWAKVHSNQVVKNLDFPDLNKDAKDDKKTR